MRVGVLCMSVCLSAADMIYDAIALTDRRLKGRELCRGRKTRDTKFGSQWDRRHNKKTFTYLII